jgi:hypothetical protein
MEIVLQSPPLSYSPFLALPAPKIAGLLPAHVGPDPQVRPSPPKTFVYEDPRLAALSDKTRLEFDKLLATLIKTTVGLLANELNEAEFGIANGTFARQVTALYHSAIVGDAKSLTAVRGKPAIASPFTSRRQQLDEKIEEMMAQSKVHLAETRERIARELAAMHARED